MRVHPTPSAHLRLPALLLIGTAVAGLLPADCQAATARPDPSRVQEPGALVRARAVASPDSLQVFLLTFGRGDRVWERFGHNAFWIHDGPAGTDRVYNWGIFDFEQENFLSRLLTGHMRYRLAVFSLRGTLRQYRAMNRSVYLQQLRLGLPKRQELQRRARVNYLPENRRYSYDPYRDNCSTRIRDHLNRVLDGELRARTGSLATDRTWRSHTLRLLRRDFLPYLGLAVGMGQPADAEITAWQEMFLPLRMRESIRSVRIDTGSSGAAPLVSREDTLYLASRPPAPARAPERRLLFLVASTLLAISMVGLGWTAGRGGVARHLFAGLAAGWSLFAGAVGTLMAAGWALTDHWFLYRNENLLQANPLFLVLAVLVALVVWGNGSRRTRRSSIGLARILLGLGLLGALLQALPAFDQVNGTAIALFLPPQVGLAIGMSLSASSDC